MKYSATFFQNRECAYFPCHAQADAQRFNCLFCYCPLYPLGQRCGGSFRYTDGGIKDCSDCLLPHCPDSAQSIARRFDELAALCRKADADRE